MSAWLCENKLLSIVVDVVKSEDFRNNYDVNGDYSDLSEGELLDLLSEINVNNLRYLYDSFPDDYEQGILDNREYVRLSVSDFQRHKSVASFVYQSCDFSGNEDIPLFCLLVKWRDDYDGLVYSSEWDEAEWDIDNPIG